MSYSYEELLKQATEAQKNAYAPYSKFPVGAAIMTKSGRVFTGCNVENASYSLSNCAERTAVFKAVSAGYTEFTAIAIAVSIEELASPCGACRQVLVEFGLDIDVIMGNNKGQYKVMTSKDLLPYCFTNKQLDDNKK